MREPHHPSSLDRSASSWVWGCHASVVSSDPLAWVRRAASTSSWAASYNCGVPLSPRDNGPRHFDAHAYSTEDYDGVKEFARGCMRTYLILKERAQRWAADKAIQTLVREVGSANPGLDVAPYSAGHRDRLLGVNFDRSAIAARGLGYERLDQLTVEIILGVR
jgi:hypothetical protein